MKRFKNILYLNEPAVDQASTIAPRRRAFQPQE